MMDGGGPTTTYGIASAVLLLCADDGSAAHGRVQSSLAADDGLALCCTAAHVLANLGDGSPFFRHLDVWLWECLVVGLIFVTFGSSGSKWKDVVVRRLGYGLVCRLVMHFSESSRF